MILSMAQCSEPGCTRTDVRSRGLCSAHYQFHRYHGTLPPSPLRECEWCGAAFQDRRRHARFCSKRCGEKAKLAQIAKGPRSTTCLQCGASLSGRPHHTLFCCDRCQWTWHNAHKAQVVREKKVATPKPPCAYCGAPLPERARKFCSRHCKSLARRAQNYNLTEAELRALLAQHSVCAICGSSDWGRKGPQVDHCHNSGKVRGILCVNCNTILGHAHDDPKLLRRAAKYLAR